MLVSQQVARDALSEEWNRLSPSTPEEIADFYKNTPNYFDDLNVWHESISRQFWSHVICAAAKACNAKRILDIGAGLGHDLLALQQQSSDYELHAVEPNIHMALALESRGIPTFNDIKEVPSIYYDMIICMDVLEHVPNPDGLLEGMIRALKPNGTFIESTATHDISIPLHLKSLRGWHAGRILDRYGFKLEKRADRVNVWVRSEESRPRDTNNLILCAYRNLSVETTGCILALPDNWRVNIHSNDALVTRVRSVAVSEWLQREDGDVFLMIDADIVFTPEDAEKVVKLAREKRSIAVAAYPVRDGRHLAARALSDSIEFSPDATEPIALRYGGTGFMAVHRDVCEAIINGGEIPLCIMHDEYFWPLFDTAYLYNETTDVYEYLSEDFAFCERAYNLGFTTWLEPSVYISHIGERHYNVTNMKGSS